MRGGWLTPRLVHFTLRKETRYPLYRRMDGLQGRSGWGRKMSPPQGFDPRNIQTVASRYTDWVSHPNLYTVYRLRFVRVTATERIWQLPFLKTVVRKACQGLLHFPWFCSQCRVSTQVPCCNATSMPPFKFHLHQNSPAIKFSSFPLVHIQVRALDISFPSWLNCASRCFHKDERSPALKL